MSATSSVRAILANSAATPTTRLVTTLEALLVYAGILLYIWRWQFTHPRLWMLLLVLILSSHLAHRDTLGELGLGLSALRANAEVVLPLALVLYTPPLIYGLVRQRLILTPPGKHALLSFLGYGVWCAFQQYLTQSYFHRRLMSLFRNLHLRSLLVGLMFGSAHIPNPVLMIVTTLGGFLFAEVFARRRNIWPLALAQAVGGVLVGSISPASLIHNMRVGPGYFFYGIR